ncbi:MAG: M16 family metallopeptidase [Vampirovibrionales bacterium]
MTNTLSFSHFNGTASSSLPARRPLTEQPRQESLPPTAEGDVGVAKATTPINTPATEASALLPPFKTPSTPLLSLPYQPNTAPVELTKPRTLANGSTVFHYALANGHQVLLEQRPSDTVSLRTFINVGSTIEQPVYHHPTLANRYDADPTKDGIPFFHSGVTHYDEHKHFDQTQHFEASNSWTKAVEGYGASLNASTAEEQVQHELHFNREDWVDMLQLHAEQVLHPLYDDKQLTQEKRNVVNEAYERMSHPQVKAQDKLCELLYDRPFFQTLGLKQDVEAIDARELQRLFDTYYQPNNMLTVVSGNLTPEQVLPLMQKTFGAKAPSPTPPNNRGVKLALANDEVRQMTLSHPRLKTQSYVMMGFPGPNNRQLKDRAALEVLLTSLTGDPQSPLQKSLVDDTGRALDVAVALSPYHHAGSVEFTVLSNLGFEEECANQILNTLGVVAHKGLPEARLKNTQALLKERYKLSLNSQSDVTYMLGTEALANSSTYMLDYLKLIDQVSEPDIRRVAQTYLNPKHYAVVYMVPGDKDTCHSKTSSKLGALPIFNNYSQPLPSTLQGANA